METYNNFNEAFLIIYKELENDNFEVEDELYELEQSVTESLDYTYDEENNLIKSLLKKIKAAKQEFDFYDEEAELDNMFPNRHDEDNMSFDSIFGDD